MDHYEGTTEAAVEDRPTLLGGSLILVPGQEVVRDLILIDMEIFSNIPQIRFINCKIDGSLVIGTTR